MPAFKMNVVTGPALLALFENVRGWQKRDCYRQLNAYLHSIERDRVCILFGLWQIGKTTLLRQDVLDMATEGAAKTAYTKATKQDTIADLNRDMEQLRSLGSRFVLLDEVTLMRDFIDSVALLSDIYAAQGMKIVLSSTDLLGFWFALRQELYDRAKMIHTTFIPYREHSCLLGIDQIDEYIRYDGTLLAVELTGAINRIIEDMSHAFLVSVLTRDFLSHNLGLAARNLRKKQTVPITKAHAAEIKEYHSSLDLIVEWPLPCCEKGT